MSIPDRVVVHAGRPPVITFRCVECDREWRVECEWAGIDAGGWNLPEDIECPECGGEGEEA